MAKTDSAAMIPRDTRFAPVTWLQDRSRGADMVAFFEEVVVVLSRAHLRASCTRRRRRRSGGSTESTAKRGQGPRDAALTEQGR
jgi:hypothetical protein